MAALHVALIAPPVASQIGDGPVQFRAAPGTYLFEGALLIPGDGSDPIENSAMLVIDGYIAELGRQGEITLPPGGTRIDLTGKTVIPTFTNVHIHIGYEGHPTWGPEHFDTENVVDHLRRSAYYGVGAVLSVGSDPPEKAIEIMERQGSGRLPPAAQYFSAPGVVPPGGGPDHILIRGTDALRAVYEVDTEEGARAAVRDIASKRLQQLKIWVGNRGGSYPEMPMEIMSAIADEANKYNIKVHAHAFGGADAKAALRAGVHVLVHPLPNPDEELLALIRERRPYWVPLYGFLNRTPLCSDDPFFLETMPAEMIRQVRQGTGRGHELGRELCAANPFGTDPNANDAMRKVIAAGARVVLGTDGGVFNHYTFGWPVHNELKLYVDAGMTPSEAIVAATSRPAELLGIRDGGVLAVLNRADFIVLNANPLEDILNTRQIEDVYIRGNRPDRNSLRSGR